MRCPFTVCGCQECASSYVNPFWIFGGKRGIGIGVPPHIRRLYDVSSVSYANKSDCISRRRVCRDWVSAVSVSNGIASRALEDHFCDCKETHNSDIVAAAQCRNRCANDWTKILDICIVLNILGMRVTTGMKSSGSHLERIECSKNLQKIDRKQRDVIKKVLKKWCRQRKLLKVEEEHTNYQTTL